MKIKMLTTKCGPVVNENWSEGEIRNVCVEEARYWYEAGVCTLLEPYPAEAEKAVITPAEKAVVTPSETAGKGKGPVVNQKPPVAPPASPDVQVSIQPPAAWGKGGAK